LDISFSYKDFQKINPTKYNVPQPPPLKPSPLPPPPLSLPDSIIKPLDPISYQVEIHGRPPVPKSKLRYNKLANYEQQIMAQKQLSQNDNFVRINIISNEIRQIFRPEIMYGKG
jgi:hypothetical protein